MALKEKDLLLISGIGVVGVLGYLIWKAMPSQGGGVPIALSQGWTLFDEVPPGWDTTAAALCTAHPEIQQVTYSSDGVNWDFVYIPGWPFPDFPFKSGMGPFGIYADPGLIIYPEG